MQINAIQHLNPFDLIRTSPSFMERVSGTPRPPLTTGGNTHDFLFFRERIYGKLGCLPVPRNFKFARGPVNT